MTSKSDDIIEVLEDMGDDVHKQTGDEINARCPVHHLYKGRESSRHSWYMNIDTGLWHCLAGDTLVLTPTGRQPIEDLARIGTATVLDGDGKWRTVPVESFGSQALHQVVLSRNGVEKVVEATSGHRWITRYGERTTDQLRPGMRIPSVYADSFTPDAPRA